MEKKKYFVGLDIGTDSVGYAVTDNSASYSLLKYQGEPMWGVSLFDEGKTSADRRLHRVERRRIDRRQQRLALLQGLFKEEIIKVDPLFFNRIEESALLRVDATEPYCLFADKDYTDKDYHRQYPTIHHLIKELIVSKQEHDIRLVYLASAWLVSHRGHFLSEISTDNIEQLSDFVSIFERFENFMLDQELDERINLSWNLPKEKIDSLGSILKSSHNKTTKHDEIVELLLDGVKPPKPADDNSRYSISSIIDLLVGKKVKLSELFHNEELTESFDLNRDEEAYEAVMGELGDDGELLKRLKEIMDWVLLPDLNSSEPYLSFVKVEQYNQHKEDLSYLKKYFRQYCPTEYSNMFKNVSENNYVAYSGCTQKIKSGLDKYKKCSKEKFYEKLNSISKSCNKPFSEEVIARIDQGTFMPKQVDGDNRVIPYQLYYVELKKILDNASNYLHFLTVKDQDGLTVIDKVLSIMSFQIPYFVGPLNNHSEFAWLERKAAGKIYPWNIEKIVDFDKTQEKFMDKLLGACSYLPDQKVLPKQSLLYQKLEVLNEINNIKINGQSIPVSAKQGIFNDLFLKKKKVTPKKIQEYLICENYLEKNKEGLVSGLDNDIKSSLSSWIAFSRFLCNGILSFDQVEKIILRSCICSSTLRFKKWLDAEYSFLSENDQKYIRSLKFSDFGRLSSKLLCEMCASNNETGEYNSVLNFMWESNDNLSVVLLSGKYQFKEAIEEYQKEYYNSRSLSLSKRLDSMYISNASKRPIIRTLEVMKDIVKANGGAPEKIFIEMARGTQENQKGKRTLSRKEQLTILFKQCKKISKELLEELNNPNMDHRLQSDKIFLYFLQLGKDMYTGETIDFQSLISGDGVYNIEHIYPRSKVKDDSITNNEILVSSLVNEKKKDTYPIDASIRSKMASFWETLKNNHLITDEKYRRLTRTTPFSEEEEWGFINRQLVETRQSTKTIASLLNEKYPDTEIIYVKAGLVSEFRQEYNRLKSRSLNDLHHAKDAYLNVVCGNVYHERFTKKWFLDNRNRYSVKLNVLFSNQQRNNDMIFWNGQGSLSSVLKTLNKNSIHQTFYSIKKTSGQSGGFYNQMPLKAGKGSFPRKGNLPVDSYGGYDGITTSFSLLVKYQDNNKRVLEFVPVVQLEAEKVLKSKEYMYSYVKDRISSKASDLQVLFDGRAIKIGTVIETDGLRLLLAGQGSKDTRVGMKVFSPLVLSNNDERYVKALESIIEKLAKNKNYIINEKYDIISQEKNMLLFELLNDKLIHSIFSNRPEVNQETVINARAAFEQSSLPDQCHILMNYVSLFNRVSHKDSVISIPSSCRLNSKISSWPFSDVRIIDQSPSGIWEKKSDNLKII